MSFLNRYFIDRISNKETNSKKTRNNSRYGDSDKHTSSDSEDWDEEYTHIAPIFKDNNILYQYEITNDKDWLFIKNLMETEVEVNNSFDELKNKVSEYRKCEQEYEKIFNEFCEGLEGTLLAKIIKLDQCNYDEEKFNKTTLKDILYEYITDIRRKVPVDNWSDCEYLLKYGDKYIDNLIKHGVNEYKKRYDIVGNLNIELKNENDQYRKYQEQLNEINERKNSQSFGLFKMLNKKYRELLEEEKSIKNKMIASEIKVKNLNINLEDAKSSEQNKKFVESMKQLELENIEQIPEDVCGLYETYLQVIEKKFEIIKDDENTDYFSPYSKILKEIWHRNRVADKKEPIDNFDEYFEYFEENDDIFPAEEANIVKKYLKEPDTDPCIDPNTDSHAGPHTENQ